VVFFTISFPVLMSQEQFEMLKPLYAQLLHCLVVMTIFFIVMMEKRQSEGWHSFSATNLSISGRF
jgi:hypothetical protein